MHAHFNTFISFVTTTAVIGWVNVTTRARAESIILRERQGNYGDLGVDYIKGSNAGNTIFTVTAVSITTGTTIVYADSLRTLQLYHSFTHV